MRFKKVAVMVMAVSLFMTSFTAGSSYASANETADTQIEGMILKSENVNIEETTVVQSVATSSSISDKSDTKASNKKTTKAKKTTKKRKKKKYSKADLRLMASIINCEAGSEPYQGKVAVGIVVMNRVSSKSFPNSIKGVIYQKGQFSPVRNGSLKKRLKQYDAKQMVQCYYNHEKSKLEVYFMDSCDGYGRSRKHGAFFLRAGSSCLWKVTAVF